MELAGKEKDALDLIESIFYKFFATVQNPLGRSRSETLILLMKKGKSAFLCVISVLFF